MIDPRKFEAFMMAYQNMVYTTAVRLLGNETQAKDVSQEVFLKAYQHYHTIASSPTAGGWLKTTTTHLCLNYLSRYRKRWQFFSEMVLEDESNEETLGVDDRLPGSRMEAAEFQEALAKALHELPDHQRIPLVLFHFNEMNYDEIADKLKVSLSKVKTDIARGRARLRQIHRPDI